MPVEILILVISIATNLLLGFVVHRRNSRSATNQIFVALGVVIACLGVVNYVSVHPPSRESALFWIRFVMFFATLNSVLFFLLMHTFPRATFQFSKHTLWLIAGMTGITMAVALSPYLFVDVQFAGDQAQPVPGLGMIFFVPVGILTIPLGLYFLIKKNIRAKGLEKIQLRYLLFGVVLTFALIVGLIFLNVVLFRNPNFVIYLPAFLMPFTMATAYAITRYRLMDIRFVVVRSVLFSLLVGTFFLIYGLLVWIATEIAVLRGVQLTPATHALAAVAVTILAVLGFQWYRALLQQVTDRTFFKARYNARASLLGLGQSLSETIDIDRILDLLTRTLRETVRVANVLVFLRDAERKAFRPTGGTARISARTLLNDTHALIRHLRHRPGAVVRDELSLILEREDPRHDPEEIKELQTAFAWLDVALVLPLVVKGEITGLLFLGDKLSGDPFSAEDVELLTILTPQAATALENARLYREAAEFGRTLEREVTRATQELRVANEQLKDTDKAKSEFLSIASHQLYTPLTAIRGYLSMIHEGDFGKVPEKLQGSLKIVRESSARLIRLIRELLDVSRIESGRLELTLESVDLVKMARELVEELRPNAEKKKLTLTFHEPPTALSPVVADNQRIRQVLLNTLDNAIKYTEKGKVDISVSEVSDNLVYNVQDTGRGMTKEAIGRLFAKFTRIETNLGRRTEGMGLGLYVARQMIREIGGDIWAESKGEGKGSIFFVKLPVEGSPQALKAGSKLIVGIKAAEAGEKSEEKPGKSPADAAKDGAKR